MKSKIGKKIFEKKKARFKRKGKNTNNWNENKRGGHFRKILSHFGGQKIPYSCFESSKKLSYKLFGKNNDWNFIYYTIFMGLDLGFLVEEQDGLKFIEK